MSIRAQTTIAYLAFSLIFIICTLVVIRWIIDFVSWTRLDSGWAQAIGSVLAIAAAIWVAHSDSRRRRQDSHAVAIITGANMQDRLQELVGCIDLSLRHLSDRSGDSVMYADIEATKNILRTRPKFTNEEIAQLAPLGGKCALKLAQLQSALGNAVGLLETLPQIRESSPSYKLILSTHIDFVDLPHSVIAAQQIKLLSVRTIIYRSIKLAE